MAAMASLALVARMAAGADGRSRMRALARGAAGVARRASIRRSTRRGRCPGRSTRPPTCTGCSRARRSSSRTAGATASRTPTRFGARRRCTGRAATCSTHVEATVAVELNAATDNPLVLVGEGIVVSNGNFHGQPLAFGLDTLAMAVSELASISERRVERLVNPSLSEGLPPFLTLEGGLNSGFMIPQYVAAALVSESKSLCHPASVDSIPTSAGQEDHVSMGNAAGPEGAAGAREQRAGAGDRAARRRAGDRVPRAARARAGRARDARRRARALRARARRPVALGGHRARRRRDRATGRSSRLPRRRSGSCDERVVARRARSRRSPAISRRFALRAARS